MSNGWAIEGLQDDGTGHQDREWTAPASGGSQVADAIQPDRPHDALSDYDEDPRGESGKSRELGENANGARDSTHD